MMMSAVVHLMTKIAWLHRISAVMVLGWLMEGCCELVREIQLLCQDHEMFQSICCSCGVVEMPVLINKDVKLRTDDIGIIH